MNTFYQFRLLLLSKSLYTILWVRKNITENIYCKEKLMEIKSEM